MISQNLYVKKLQINLCNLLVLIIQSNKISNKMNITIKMKINIKMKMKHMQNYCN